MRKILYVSTILLTVAIGLASCHGGQRVASEEGDTLEMRYAKFLTIVDHGETFEATVLNPWKPGEVLHKYTFEKGKKYKAVVFTGPHTQLLHELGADSAIVGLCDVGYMNVPAVTQRKDVVDCGSSMDPDVERIIDLHPDLLVVSPFENSGGYGNLGKSGIPIIEAADYMETHPLGRAEWIRLYGRIFSTAEKADSIFDGIDKTYRNLKSGMDKLPKGRSVMMETKTGNVWYTPGGQSTVGVALADAGAQYVFADDKSNGSLTLAPEQVIDRASDAEVWLIKSYSPTPVTRASLQKEYSGYATLRAFKSGEIYSCNTMKVPYFEETSFHPERLLSELIQITHPGYDLGGLRYYQLVKDK